MSLRPCKKQTLFKITYPYLVIWMSYVDGILNGMIKLYIVEVKKKERMVRYHGFIISQDNIDFISHLPISLIPLLSIVISFFL